VKSCGFFCFLVAALPRCENLRPIILFLCDLCVLVANLVFYMTYLPTEGMDIEIKESRPQICLCQQQTIY
jgi:hypothetical protein